MKPSQKHSDAIFYEIAADEIQKGLVDKGLMAKAAVKTEGDKKKAEVLYMEWRVELLKEQAIEEAAKADKLAKEKAAKAAKEAESLRRKKEEERFEKERIKREQELNDAEIKHYEEQQSLPFYKRDLFYGIIAISLFLAFVFYVLST